MFYAEFAEFFANHIVAERFCFIFGVDNLLEFAAYGFPAQGIAGFVFCAAGEKLA